MGNNIGTIPLLLAFVMLITNGDTQHPIFIASGILLVGFLVFLVLGNIWVALFRKH